MMTMTMPNYDPNHHPNHHHHRVMTMMIGLVTGITIGRHMHRHPYHLPIHHRHDDDNCWKGHSRPSTMSDGLQVGPTDQVDLADQ